MDSEKDSGLDELSAHLDEELENKTLFTEKCPVVSTEVPNQSERCSFSNPNKLKTLKDFDILGKEQQSPDDATMKNLPYANKILKTNTNENKHEKSEGHQGDTDSSDDEDNKYAAEQNYTDTGRAIKNLIKKQTTFSKQQSKTVSRCSSWKGNKSLFAPGETSSTLAGSNPSRDVYTDPYFGIRIVNPNKKMKSINKTKTETRGCKKRTLDGIHDILCPKDEEKNVKMHCSKKTKFEGLGSVKRLTSEKITGHELKKENDETVTLKKRFGVLDLSPDTIEKNKPTNQNQKMKSINETKTETSGCKKRTLDGIDDILFPEDGEKNVKMHCSKKTKFKGLGSVKRLTSKKITGHELKKENVETVTLKKRFGVLDLFPDAIEKQYYNTESIPFPTEIVRKSHRFPRPHFTDMSRSAKHIVEQNGYSRKSQGGTTAIFKAKPSSTLQQLSTGSCEELNPIECEETKTENLAEGVPECCVTRLKDLVHSNSPKLGEFRSLKLTVPSRAAKQKALENIKRKGSILKKESSHKGTSSKEKRRKRNEEGVNSDGEDFN